MVYAGLGHGYSGLCRFRPWLLVFSGHGYTIFGFEMVMIFGDGFTGFASGLAWFLVCGYKVLLVLCRLWP